MLCTVEENCVSKLRIHLLIRRYKVKYRLTIIWPFGYNFVVENSENRFTRDHRNKLKARQSVYTMSCKLITFFGMYKLRKCKYRI